MDILRKQGVAVIGGDVGVGIHIIERLHKEGFQDIRCVGTSSFPGSASTTFDICSVSSYVCNVASKKEIHTLRKALSEVSVVICALFPPMTSSSELLQEQNVDAVKILLEECETYGVDSFIFLSSTAVMNHSMNHMNSDETVKLPTSFKDYQSVYDRTKRMGEDLVLLPSLGISSGDDDLDQMWRVVLRCGHIINTYKDLAGRFEPVNYLLYHGARVDTIDGMNVAWATFLALKSLQYRRMTIENKNLERKEKISDEVPSLSTTGEKILTLEDSNSFMYDDDCCDGDVVHVDGEIESAKFSDEVENGKLTRINRQVFYVTKGEPVTLFELSLMIQRKINNKIVILPSLLYSCIYCFLWFIFYFRYFVFFFQDDTGTPLHVLLNMGKNYTQTFSNEKAVKMLNYSPIVSMEDSIDRMVQEYKKQSPYFHREEGLQSNNTHVNQD
jgi:nucleoside-diphosphate-sugar epimerase